MHQPANDNEAAKKLIIGQALEKHFPALLPILYQGKLVALSECVSAAAKAKGLAYDDLKMLMFEHEERVKAGASVKDQLARMGDALGDTRAAAAFVLLYSVRESARAMICDSRSCNIASSVRREGVLMPEAFKINAKANAQRNSLAKTLSQYGGVGEELAMVYVRRFEAEANRMIDAELGQSSPSVS